MGSYLEDAPAGDLLRVLVTYSADILGSGHDIEHMGPAEHLPAGFGNGYRKRVGEVVASRFEQIAGDEDYEDQDPDALGHDERYLPARDCPDDYEGDGYQGRHRTWEADLSYPEWRVFASRYLIEVDERGLPVEYEDCWGGPNWTGPVQVSVDNTEGWGDSRGDYVIHSTFNLAFAFGRPAGRRDCRCCGDIASWHKENQPVCEDCMAAKCEPTDDGPGGWLECQRHGAEGGN